MFTIKNHYVIINNKSMRSDKIKSKSTVNIKSIVIFFAISIIIFGICIISKNVYSLYKDSSNKNSGGIVEVGKNKEEQTKPTIVIERIDDTNINIIVESNVGIDEVVYKWNSDEQSTIAGNGEKTLEKEIAIPLGKNTITLTAIDVNGNSDTYDTSYENNSINLTLEKDENSNNIKVVATSSVGIAYISYYWDDEEAVKYESNDVKAQTLIEVREGTHTLNVKAVDLNGEEKTKSQKITGSYKPEVTVETDGEYFNIVAKDADNISKVELTVNGGEMQTETVNSAQYIKDIKLEDGWNTLIVTVYNSSGLSDQAKVKYLKE